MQEEILDEGFEDVEAEEDQYLVFNVKSQEFGIQALRVKEISSIMTTTDVPNAPPYIEGIMNLRGRLASVINFRKRFGYDPRAYDEDTRVIIVEKGGFPIGILVDSVEEVIKIMDENVQKLPESTRSSVTEECITGVGMLDKRLIILLDLDRVLSKEDWGSIVPPSGFSSPIKDQKTKRKAQDGMVKGDKPGSQDGKNAS